MGAVLGATIGLRRSLWLAMVGGPARFPGQE
jgi:hypothetical protein